MTALMIGLALAFVGFSATWYAVSPTNRYFNTSGWQFTPAGGSALLLTGITNYSFDEGISTKKESADFDLFPTVSVNDYRDPTITLDTLDAFALETTASGVRGTLTGNVRDAYNGIAVSGGGRSVTMTNAQIQGRTSTHAHREYGRRQLVFGAISSDGSTHPVSTAAL